MVTKKKKKELVSGISGLLVLVIILSSAFLGTFASSIWTLSFMQITGYTGGQTVLPDNEAPDITDTN